VSLLDDYKLEDRYRADHGRAFLTGIQALARIPIQQLRVDRTKGLNTAAFVSGYQGSPLGGFDVEVARAAALVPDLAIVNQPAVNEELAATAVMGSQLAAEQPDCRYDGVLGIWYGKAPGLDRAGDALRHAVFAGTSRHGGAIAIVGDDPAAKSSTLPSSSDAALVDLHMPILYPGDVQEVLDLGMHAVALSRITGLWTALKIVAAVADGNGTVDLDPEHVVPVVPDLSIDGRPYEHHPDGQLLTPHTLELERDFREARSELVRRYTIANRLNHTTIDPPDAWIGLVASGFTYHELLHALGRLGLTTHAEIAAVGIRLLHMRVPVPFDPSTIRTFARGLDEILIVEEKNPTLEWLVKDALYGGPDQPRVVGKTHPDGRTLMPNHGILDADTILVGLRERLSARLADRLTPEPTVREHALLPLSIERTPYFCSGCPHNWGTKVPEDALVGAGIGCHGMVLLMEEDKVGRSAGITAMGSEGSQWIGMSPFVEREHFTQNIGDGTFFHSGQLAIQAAVAADVRMTYKLLYNGTVAMTGGQDATNGVGVPQIASILLSHGVSRVLITTEDTARYKGVRLPGDIQVWDRTRIIEAQEILAAVDGVTVLIHDQACAAQTRRLRKRGKAETPGFRVVINHRLCEACGDCGEVSNCLSVQPVETDLGVKTTIDQSSCNLDASCLEGDCPSFMTVAVDPDDPATAKAPGSYGSGDLVAPVAIVDTGQVDIRLAGIGGTGVVTVAQILATAAMIDGYDVRGLDQTGLSQKAGPVISDLRLSRNGPRASNLVGEAGADVILAFDLLVGASAKTMHAAGVEQTVMVASTSETPTGSMVGHPEKDLPTVEELVGRADSRTHSGLNRFVDASAISHSLFGDAAPANVLLLGVAVQAGAIPVDPASVERAIGLNGVAVDRNRAAFRAGRRWAMDPSAFDSADDPDGRMSSTTMDVPELPADLRTRVEVLDGRTGLGPLIGLLAADLVGYQDARCASGYLDLVEAASTAEQGASAGSVRLTEAVARGLHKLTAYKDEYEVARLLIGPEGRSAAASIGGPGAAVTWRLHPPFLRALGMTKKLAIPATIGRPAMWLLSKGRRLRGTALDPFGRAEVRRLERTLVAEYRSAISQVLDGLTASGLDDAVATAALAMDVRGYEEIKMARGRTVLDQLRDRATDDR
jgi:indolepyruvate ferredoxin oxidoreductase